MRNRIIFWLFIAAFLYFWVGGTLSYQLANLVSIEHFDFSYTLDFGTATLFCAIALLSFLAGYAIIARLGTATSQGDSAAISAPGAALKIALAAVFAIGAVGFLLMIRQYGWRIPMFAEHADEFRTNIDSGLPQLLYFNLIASSLIAYALAVRSTGRRLFWIAVAVASLFLIFLGGSRSMLFTPLLVMAIDLWRRRAVGTVVLISSGVAAFTMMFLIGLFRLESDLAQGIYLLRFVTDVAPEFREFAKLLTIVPSQEPYLFGQMFANSAVILMPGKVLALVGLDKTAIWQPFGEYLKNLFGYDFLGGGLRAGIIAEWYANFSLVGIIVGFWSTGFLVRLVEIGLSRVGSVGRMLLLVSGLSLATSVLFTLDAVIYKLVAIGAGWGIFVLTTHLFASPLFSAPRQPVRPSPEQQPVTFDSH